MGLVHEKDQAWNSTLNGTVVFHFGDGNLLRIIRLRHKTIAIGKNAEIDTCVIYHGKRLRGCCDIASGQMLHHHGKHSLSETCSHHLLAMLRQVARGAADHYSE